MTEPRLVHVVPHTHWDREWYFPFQRFRMTLVDLVDRLLDLMEADPRYVFTLDGQLATVDDYLEIRPENERRIRTLVEAGQLAIGPWQILVDEFLVSGESIVRNLELGLRRAEELGGAMRIGYLPDMFGHVAQMPQLLCRAGIERAVVWRGVPAAIDHHVFRWSALDGSELVAEYLVGGYGAGAYLFDEPESLEASLDQLAATLEPFFDGDELLAMVGTDHKLPMPDLVEQIEQLNGGRSRFRLRLATLGDYLAGANGDGAVLPHWRGELRSGARANLLMGVTSARIDLKAACARAERLLERYAEPLQALYGEGRADEFLELAWRRAIDNSAHDSICGCSADAVSQQVLVRFAEAEQIAAELVRRAAASVAQGVPEGAFAILNPSPEARADLVELDVSCAAGEQIALELPGGELVAAQEVGRREPLLAEDTILGAEIGSWVGRRLHGRELFGLWLNRVAVEKRELTLEVGDAPEPVDAVLLDGEISAAAVLAPEEHWRVRIVAAQRSRVVACVPAPALGWTAARLVSARAEGAVRGEDRRISNGRVDITAEDGGTFRIGELSGIGRLVDGGDCGDSYNYAAPADDELVEQPTSVSVELTAAGPVRAELTVVRTYRWPLGLAPGSSARAAEVVDVPVTTRLELREGEPFVRVRIAFDNPAADHRLRFHIPLPRPAPSSFAEGQFGVVERTGAPEGGWGEVPLATYPARGFVAAGGLAALLDHVTEYEVLDERELALTVLRSTGLISRAANPYRDDPAGPEVAIPAAQCRGPWSFGFALYPHDGTWEEADVARWAERYHHPFVVAAATGAPDLPLRAEAGLRLEGRGVVLSSLRRRPEGLELRLVCLQPEASSATVAGRFTEAREADLLGQAGDPLPVASGELRLELRPWEIRTVLLGV